MRKYNEQTAITYQNLSSLVKIAFAILSENFNNSAARGIIHSGSFKAITR